MFRLTEGMLAVKVETVRVFCNVCGLQILDSMAPPPCARRLGWCPMEDRPMTIEELEKWLKSVLGGTYGGPSLSWDDAKQQFVLYEWTDAPVDSELLAEGTTLSRLRADYNKRRR